MKPHHCKHGGKQMRVRGDHEGLMATVRLTILAGLAAGSLIGVADASLGYRATKLQAAAIIVMMGEVSILACVVILSILFVPAALLSTDLGAKN
jgi:hypothetical protein